MNAKLTLESDFACFQSLLQCPSVLLRSSKLTINVAVGNKGAVGA